MLGIVFCTLSPAPVPNALRIISAQRTPFPRTTHNRRLHYLTEVEFYKLEQTFSGAIILEPATGYTIPPPAIKPASQMTDDKRSLLDEVIKAINEKYQGDFTEGDRVLIGDLLQRLLKDEKLRKIARTANPKIFKNNQFPKFFEETAQNAYIESNERYTRMFEDIAKYKAIMNAVGSATYREFRNAGF